MLKYILKNFKICEIWVLGRGCRWKKKCYCVILESVRWQLKFNPSKKPTNAAESMTWGHPKYYLWDKEKGSKKVASPSLFSLMIESTCSRESWGGNKVAK